jgi:hypothetical protein
VVLREGVEGGKYIQNWFQFSTEENNPKKVGAVTLNLSIPLFAGSSGTFVALQGALF